MLLTSRSGIVPLLIVASLGYFVDVYDLIIFFVAERRA